MLADFKSRKGNLSFMQVLSILLRLRQICIAPFLVCPQSKRSYQKDHPDNHDPDVYQEDVEEEDEKTTKPKQEEDESDEW